MDYCSAVVLDRSKRNVEKIQRVENFASSMYYREE